MNEISQVIAIRLVSRQFFSEGENILIQFKYGGDDYVQEVHYDWGLSKVNYRNEFMRLPFQVL